MNTKQKSNANNAYRAYAIEDGHKMDKKRL